MPTDEDQAERHDGEVEPPQPGGERGDDDAGERRDQARRRQPEQHLGHPEAKVPPVRVTTEHRRGVRADAEEERMPQRDLAGVPGHEPQPDHADRRDQRLR